MTRLLDDSILEVLAARRVQLLLAVQPGPLRPVLRVLDRAESLGLAVGLWPMLHDVDGRWWSARNGDAFLAWVETLLSGVRGRPIETLALDVEPPIDELRGLVAGRLPSSGFRRGGPSRADEVLALAADRGLETFAAVLPPVVWSRGGARCLGHGIEERVDRLSPMAYASLFEGYSRGWVRRRVAHGLVRATAQQVGRLPNASLSLGCVGLGALGDEPLYRGPGELAEDVAAARGEGVDDLALFNLAGLLERPPAEAWLDALSADAEAGHLPRRLRVALRALGLADGVLRTAGEPAGRR
jgi:hypothetical protein